MEDNNSETTVLTCADDTCFFCSGDVSGDDFCCGCQEFICDSCSQNDGVSGSHQPEEHGPDCLLLQKQGRRLEMANRCTARVRCQRCGGAGHEETHRRDREGYPYPTIEEPCPACSGASSVECGLEMKVVGTGDFSDAGRPTTLSYECQRENEHVKEAPKRED